VRPTFVPSKPTAMLLLKSMRRLSENISLTHSGSLNLLDYDSLNRDLILTVLPLCEAIIFSATNKSITHQRPTLCTRTQTSTSARQSSPTPMPCPSLLPIYHIPILGSGVTTSSCPQPIHAATHSESRRTCLTPAPFLSPQSWLLLQRRWWDTLCAAGSETMIRPSPISTPRPLSISCSLGGYGDFG